MCSCQHYDIAEAGIDYDFDLLNLLHHGGTGKGHRQRCDCVVLSIVTVGGVL